MDRWREFRAWMGRHVLLADAAFAVLLSGIAVLVWVIGPLRHMAPFGPVPALWIALEMSTVVIRRRWTRIAVLLLAAHTTALLILEIPNEGLALTVLTYTAAAYLPLWQAIVATLLLWVPPLTVSAIVGAGLHPDPALIDTVYVVIANGVYAVVFFLAGRIVYTRRRYISALEERARAAEQNQATMAGQAVAEERRRIARELHDVVAHHVSVMNVLATGSRRVLARDPGAVDEALATIEETGRTALREMRRLLDVLRTEPEPVGELAPQPGLGAVTGLVEQVQEAGLPVRLKIIGEPGRLESGMALTVYRIVQEALTNSLKHAGPEARAEVCLEVGQQWLTVEVVDTGRGPGLRPATVGHGLVGMRERVALYGGTLRTGPRPGGGFRVYARIPLEATT